jgi:hypothetical protein
MLTSKVSAERRADSLSATGTKVRGVNQSGCWRSLLKRWHRKVWLSFSQLPAIVLESELARCEARLESGAW